MVKSLKRAQNIYYKNSCDSQSVKVKQSQTGSANFFPQRFLSDFYFVPSISLSLNQKKNVLNWTNCL